MSIPMQKTRWFYLHSHPCNNTEAALPQHASTTEMELKDVPELLPIPSADALFGGTPVEAALMELDTTTSQPLVKEARAVVTWPAPNTV